MKNIVKITRFTDQRTRLYALPEGFSIEEGTLVKIGNRSIYGIAACDSFTVDDDQAVMIAKVLNLSTDSLDNGQREDPEAVDVLGKSIRQADKRIRRSRGWRCEVLYHRR